MNQINLIGKIKGDIINYKQSNGEATSKFKISIETKSDRSITVDCIAWKNTAEKIHEEVRSNDLVGLTGRLNPRIITVNGVETPFFEVLVERINLILPEYEITKFE